MKKSVLDYLFNHAVGKENAVSGRELVEAFGLEDTYEIRAVINDLRNDPDNFILIGSTRKGYFIPKNEEERIKAVQLMLSKTLGQIKTVINMHPAAANIIHTVAGKHLRKANKIIDGQLTYDFDDWELKIIKKYAK